MKADTVLMRRKGNVLAPADARAADLLAKMKDGEAVSIKVARGRSLPQHNLLWSILDHVAKASKFETPERLLVAIKLRLGRYDLMKMPGGKVVPVPNSISFQAMSGDDFRTFFDDALRIISEEVCPGISTAELIEMVQGKSEAA